MQLNSNQFNIPVVTRNIIGINILMFIMTQVLGTQAYEYFALFNYQSDYFKGWQVLTHIFMHGSFTHILFNMFGVYMFG